MRESVVFFAAPLTSCTWHAGLHTANIFLLHMPFPFLHPSGCKRKFKVAEFVAMYKGAAEKAREAELKYTESEDERKPKASSKPSKKRGTKRKNPQGKRK